MMQSRMQSYPVENLLPRNYFDVNTRFFEQSCRFKGALPCTDDDYALTLELPKIVMLARV